MRATLASLALLLAVPALAQPAPPPPGELPSLVTPKAYRLNFTVDPNRPDFTGHTEIDILTDRETSTIDLHGRDLAVAHVEARTGKMVADPARYAELLPTGVARLTFERPLAPGRHTLVFDYSAKFQSGAQGLYRVKVGDDWYAYTQFESIDARRAFPSFDEPGHKTPFDVAITAPTAEKVFSNTNEVSATPAGAMTTHVFGPTKPLPTYLVALGVGPFEVKTATVAPNGVRTAPLIMRGIAERGQGRRLAFTMANAPKLLGLLETYFGVPFPYEKLDLMASPIMGGAMENAGLIIYDDTIILSDPNAPPSQLLGLGSVIAHEMAHQWFGDLVTPKWWTDIWLNESFATWAAQKIATQWNPKAGAGVADLNGALGAMNLDSLGHGRPIRQTITRNEDIDSAFDSITYEKGGQVLRMMEAMVGPEAFQKGVHAHLVRHAYGNATADEFFGAIADAADNPLVTPAFHSFVDQQGVPLVTLARRSDGGFGFRQERYLPIGVAAGAAQRWVIPMCLRSGEGQRCVILPDAVGQMPPLVGTVAWVMPNAGGTGYYRFDLDHAGWDALIAASGGLPAPEAMATGDSLWASFAAGRAPFDQVLNGARALAGQDEERAVALIPDYLNAYEGRFFTPADRANYRRFVAATFASRLAALGFDPRGGAYAAEPSERRSLRRKLVEYQAIEAEASQTRATLARAAEAALGGNDRALDPEFREVAFTVAAQTRGTPFVDRLFARLVASNDPLFRQDAAFALGSLDRAALAPHILELSRDPRLRGREPLYLIIGTARQPSTRDLGYRFAVQNFDRLVAATPLIASFTLGVGSGYCSEDRARAVEADLRPKVAQYHLSALELDRSIETIRKCAAFKAAKGVEMSAGLAAAR